MPEQLKDYLLRLADADGLLSLSAVKAAAEKFSLTLKEIEQVVLENGLFPERYQRQREIFGNLGQLRLLQARVAIIGCGGLGGSIFAMLVRLGVGHLLVIDPDFFVESNLNRQSLATVDNLKSFKAEAAREWGRAVNPAIHVEALNQVFQSPEAEAQLKNCDLVFDALDSIPARLELAALCARHGKMLIHGAVAGWYGQVIPVPPGSQKMDHIYPQSSRPDGDTDAAMGVEAVIGNLAPTVNAIAAFQVAKGVEFLVDADLEADLSGCFIDMSGPELERLR